MNSSPTKYWLADEQRVAADLERVGDRIIEAGLDPVARDRRDSVAGQDLDIAVGVGERAVGADLQRIEEARIHEGVAGVELQASFDFRVTFGLDALAARRADVLEIAESLQHRARNREDVVGVGGAETADLPSERSDIQLLGAAQASLDRAGHHLLQRRIGDQECRDDAGMRRIGAAEFQRRRRAVGFGIAGIGGQSGVIL